MRCPFCDHPDTKVIDARNQRDAPVKRRRRECSECARRFTTYERIEDLLPMVIKRDGRREPFDRLKVISGIQKACEKRPVSTQAIEECVQRVERAVLDSSEREFDSTRLGEEVRAELRALDPVAWLRFTSVYLNFRTIEEFRAALDEIEALEGESG
ncbi:MAG: transcriptional repressor NrdR [Deltaproteobacteria bacterium]|nr:MAG: transcriptional repressor NrdR [Deltaproteobacteria bacterium]TDJ09688.1 MAG: transcriptional repressor NrdR [Deltaproteobacteria bacterium]